MKPKFFIITTVADSLPFFRGQLNILKKEFTISLVSNPGVHLEKMSKEYEVSKFPIKMEREISPLKDLMSFFKLLVLFIKKKPNLVHANTPKASLLAIMAAWFSCVPARIYYVHGLRYITATGTKRRVLIMMEKITCHFATHIIAVSQGVKEEMHKTKITNKEIEIIWNGSINGIDTDHFDDDIVESIDIKGIEPTDFVYGFVGRIVKDKGINELVESFNKLSKEYKNVKLLLVGSFESSDPISAETRQQIEDSNKIVFLGRQSDVRPFLKRMDAFVLPSYREGLCGVILEASSMKTPILASDIMGIKEVVKDNYNGILVNVKNNEQLLEAMRLFYLNENKLSYFSTNGRNFVLNNFKQNILWKHSLEEYLKIMKNYV